MRFPSTSRTSAVLRKCTRSSDRVMNRAVELKRLREEQEVRYVRVERVIQHLNECNWRLRAAAATLFSAIWRGRVARLAWPTLRARLQAIQTRRQAAAASASVASAAASSGAAFRPIAASSSDPWGLDDETLAAMDIPTPKTPTPQPAAARSSTPKTVRVFDRDAVRRQTLGHRPGTLHSEARLGRARMAKRLTLHVMIDVGRVCAPAACTYGVGYIHQPLQPINETICLLTFVLSISPYRRYALFRQLFEKSEAFHALRLQGAHLKTRVFSLLGRPKHQQKSLCRQHGQLVAAGSTAGTFPGACSVAECALTERFSALGGPTESSWLVWYSSDNKTQIEHHT